ncbi:MAG: response regulator [Spirochaetes bacterium]|nr:response regulator [Spirochaetota bacterium]
MPEMTARILLVEDNKTDALLLQHSLAEVTAADVALTWVECIGDGLAALRKNTFDIVLLDLTLADSSGPDTYARIQKTAPHLPIVVLTGSLDEAAGVEAIRRGVQDYLVKGVSGGDIVTRSIRYAIERKDHRRGEG